MRKLILLALAAVAALAVMAPAASATNAITVEGPSGTCGSTDKTDCDIHVVNSGLVELESSIFGIHIASCENEYDLHVKGDGTGTIDAFSFTGTDSDCATFTACNTPWTFNGEEASGVVEGDITACVSSPSIPNQDNKCTGEVDITLDHDVTEAHTVNETTFGLCGLNGEWALEAGSDDYTVH